MVPSLSSAAELAAAGLLVGTSVGLTGMGGGALTTPLLILVLGVNPTAAVGSDLLASAVMKPAGVVAHHRAGAIRWELVRWIAPAAAPAGFAGAFLTHLLGGGAALERRLKFAVGGALLLALLGMGARAALARRRRSGSNATGAHEPLRVRRAPLVLIGLVGGVTVGMTSVGSGSLILVSLMLTHPRLRAADLVGTDLAQAIPLVGAAALGHLAAGDARLAVAAPLLLGAAPATYLAARLSARIPGGMVTWILAVLLLASGLALWHVPFPVTAGSCAVLAAGACVARVRADRQAPPLL